MSKRSECPESVTEHAAAADKSQTTERKEQRCVPATSASADVSSRASASASSPVPKRANTPDPAIRALANLRDKEKRTTQMLAVAMHEAVCGSWDAAGFEVREGFLLAGESARQALAAQGWDLFSFPDGGWGLVT